MNTASADTSLIRISLIVSMNDQRAIGKNGGMPWHLTEDLKYFKATTMGHPVIMGRKTYESIGRALPGRDNWVLSRSWTQDQRDLLLAQGIHTESRLEHVLVRIQQEGRFKEAFVIGGQQVYEVALPLCHRIYLTRVKKEIEDADAFFPEFSERDFFEVSRHESIGSKDGTAMTFTVLERIGRK